MDDWNLFGGEKSLYKIHDNLLIFLKSKYVESVLERALFLYKILLPS